MPAVNDYLHYIEADASRGFSWPYYIHFPVAAASKSCPLMVVPNNTGKGSDDFLVHRESAEREIRNLSQLFPEMGLLSPIFPRPSIHWQYYTHALDRDTLLIDSSFDSSLVRIDLQLLAMIGDAASRFGVHLPEGKFTMFGFSAAGQFVNRFTLLHPKYVRAAIAGGCGGHIVPIDELEGVRLPYSVGTSDYEHITGQPFDRECFRQVPHLFFMGEQDTNDPVPYGDGYDPEERAIIYRIFGEEGRLLQRFRKVEQVFSDLGATATFRVYKDTDHRFTAEMLKDVLEFVQQAY